MQRKATRVNLYNPLDKTVVIWTPRKHRHKEQGYLIYIMRPRSSANAMEWYTFLRTTLGWRRSQQLEIFVPDLSVRLILERPFEKCLATIRSVC